MTTQLVIGSALLGAQLGCAAGCSYFLGLHGVWLLAVPAMAMLAMSLFGAL